MRALRYLAFTWAGRAVVGLVAVTLVAGLVIVPRISASAPPAQIRSQAVTRANVTQSVSVSGSVTAETVRVGFRPQGRLVEISVKVGDTVAAGQVLARLDPTDLQTAVKQAQANVLSAQARYDTTVAGASAEDIALARNTLDTATANADQAQKNARSDLSTAQQNLEKSRTAYATAKLSFATLTSAIVSDAQAYGASIADLQGRALAIRGALRDALRPGDVTTAHTAMLSAESSLQQATTYAGSIQGPAVSDYGNAVGMVQAATNILDRALSAGADVTSASGVYQSAQTSLATAASRLSSALDVVSSQVSSAQASVSQAQAALATPTARTDPGLDGIRSDLASLQLAFTSAQQLSGNAKSRVSQASTSLTPITDAMSGSLLNAQQTVTNAQEKLATTSASQEIALRNAQLQFQKSTATPKSSDIAIALSSLQLAQIALDKATTDLDAATLRAPSAGAIASIANQVGETPATSFIVLALTSKLTLHGTVGEADVAKLRSGQVATVVVDVVGTSNRLTGRVGSIDPVATISQGVPVYGIDVTIDVPDPAVRGGMTGTASVIVASKQGVLTVPNAAIRTSGGVRSVQVLKDGEAQDAQVTFGIANDTVTEVVSGLSEGDLVVIPQRTTTATASQRPGGFGAPGGGVIIR